MKKLSLTFDDGPGNSTLPLLLVLDALRVDATFFMIGNRILENLRIAGEVMRRGHEIGNHTMTHADLISASKETAEREIVGSGRYFRPPYGRLSMPAVERVNDLWLQFVMWDIDSFDWALPTADAIEQQIDEQVGDGGIILMHDGDSRDKNADMTRTVEVVSRIIPKCRKLGYEFVPLSEMELPGKPRKTSL